MPSSAAIVSVLRAQTGRFLPEEPWKKAFTLLCGFACSLLSALHMALTCNKHCRFVQATTRIVAQSQHDSGSVFCEVSQQ